MVGLKDKVDALQAALDVERAAWSRSRSNLLRDVDQELKRRKTAEAQRDVLLVALERIMLMDVKGHALQDRLQFTPAGRLILEECQSAIQQVRSKE